MFLLDINDQHTNHQQASSFMASCKDLPDMPLVCRVGGVCKPGKLPLHLSAKGVAFFQEMPCVCSVRIRLPMSA